MTNYEKIKSMSIEEMDKFIGRIMDCCCLKCEECPLPFSDSESCDIQSIKQWLESEVNENANE